MTDEGTEQTVTTGEVVSTPDTSGEWLSPPAAADRLGMSERTLWRKVSEGRYQKRVVNRRAEILVPVPVTGATEENQENALVAPDRAPDSMALAVIDELKQQRRQDNETIASLTGRLTALERENAVLKERLTPWWRRLWPSEKVE